MLSNNLEKVNERVGLVVSFEKKITPLLLLWRGRKIQIIKNNLFFRKKIGKKIYYYFFVSDQNNNGYKLCFDTNGLEWVLEEVTF